jgi:hypothetical protein
MSQMVTARRAKMKTLGQSWLPVWAIWGKRMVRTAAAMPRRRL